MSVAVSVYEVCERVCLCVKGRLCMLFFLQSCHNNKRKSLTVRQLILGL